MIDTSGINVLYWTEFNPTKLDIEEYEELECESNQVLIENFIPGKRVYSRSITEKQFLERPLKAKVEAETPVKSADSKLIHRCVP